MKKLFIVALALLFTGCVSVVKPLDAKYSPEPQHSYVYADLLVADDSNSIFGRMTVAIALLNTDTTQVTYLPLKRKETAYIVQIAPGNYKVKGGAFLIITIINRAKNRSILIFISQQSKALCTT